MKIKVVLNVDVDPGCWGPAYGEDPQALREEVRHYVSGLVSGAEASRRGAIVGVGVAGRRVRPTDAE